VGARAGGHGPEPRGAHREDVDLEHVYSRR
jgi:hypothetical protein